MKFSFDDLKDKLNREDIAAWIDRYRRQVAIGLIALVLIIVAIVGIAGSSGGEETDSEEVTAETDTGETVDAGDTEETAEADDNPLEQDAYPEVNELVETYYACIAAGDIEGLSAVEDETDEEEQERILRSTDLVEEYQNISCYTKKGLEDGSYLVFVYYELKFYQIDTAAPGISPLYVYTNDEGSLVIFNGETGDELNAYVEEMAAEEDVIALMEEVAEAYENAKASDSDLAELEERYLRIAEDSTSTDEDADTEEEEDKDADSEDEDEDDGDEDDGDEDNGDEDDGDDDLEDDSEEEEETATADTGDATEQNRETRFTESVRLRSEPSTDGEYLGTAYQGESVTQIESYESGWSKINYNGTECYCMTEYLE